MFQFSMTPGADPQQVLASLEENYRMAREEIGWAPDEQSREAARSRAAFFKQAIAEAKRQAGGQSQASPGMMPMPPFELPPLPALPKTGLESILRDILQ